jgi:hypothetical protein
VEEPLSQRDLPLWARVVAALLLLVASWWLVHTDAVRDVAGDTIAVLALGIIAASILRGMHLPLGLWPAGPWRSHFSNTAMVGVALAFGGCVVAFAPSETLGGQLDPAMFITVVVGVIAWGIAWAMVRQHPYRWWYGIAVGLGLVPLLVGLLGTALPGGTPLCLVVVAPVEQGTACEAPALQTLVFLIAVVSPMALVTLEIAFRRLLIGQPHQAGLLLVLAAAAVHAGWLALVAPGTPAIGIPWWIGGGVAVGAGALFSLSRSVLVSSVYTGVALASYEALVRATPVIPGTDGAPVEGWPYRSAALLVAILLAALVQRRCGVLTGIR